MRLYSYYIVGVKLQRQDEVWGDYLLKRLAKEEEEKHDGVRNSATAPLTD